MVRRIPAFNSVALFSIDGEVGFRENKSAPTLNEFCRDRVEPWARSMFEQTSVNTWRWYRAGLRSIYAYSPLACMKLNEITSESGADFAAHRQAEGLEVASVNASVRVLRRVLKLALEWGIIPSAPKLRLLRGERHRERVISPEEEAKYLAAASDLLASVATILARYGYAPR
jgi:Phage integrase SAM-like domain